MRSAIPILILMAILAIPLTAADDSRATITAKVVSIHSNDAGILVNNHWLTLSSYTLSNGLEISTTCTLTVGQTVTYEASTSWSPMPDEHVASGITVGLTNCPVYITANHL